MRRKHLLSGSRDQWARSHAGAINRDLPVAYPVIDIRGDTGINRLT